MAPPDIATMEAGRPAKRWEKKSNPENVKNVDNFLKLMGYRKKHIFPDTFLHIIDNVFVLFVNKIV